MNMKIISERYVLKCIVIMIISIFIIAGCTHAEEPKMKTGVPYYFQWVAMKMKTDFPIRPVEQISKDDAQKMRAYYVAYYDNKGRIISCSKILDGKIDWITKYYYNTIGYLDKEEYTGPDGALIITYYDKLHNVIKKEKILRRK